MKSPLVKAVKGMVILGAMGVIISTFFPFIGWEFLGGSDYLNFFGVVEDTERYIWAVVMVGALIVSLVTRSMFETSTKISTSIWMVIAALVGEIGYRVYVSLANQYFFLRYGMGKSIMGGAYVVLIVAAFVALGIDIYSFCVRDGQKKKEVAYAGGYKCPKCGIVSKEKSKYCSGCGFSMGSFTCPDCGAEREIDSKVLFCKECGHRLPVLHMGGSGYGSVTHKTEESKSVVAQRISKLAKIEESIGMHWVCEKCGEENSSNSRFCQKCGGGR